MLASVFRARPERRREARVATRGIVVAGARGDAATQSRRSGAATLDCSPSLLRVAMTIAVPWGRIGRRWMMRRPHPPILFETRMRLNGRAGGGPKAGRRKKSA